MSSFQFVPPLIAHRGASADSPENTMIAFTKVAQLGIKWVEFDVMLAACGTPIVFHDERLERTTNGQGFVNQFPYVYLQTLDAGAWFNAYFANERIPTLSQVLSFLSEMKMHANVELKAQPGHEEQLVIHVLRIINALKLDYSTLLFSSFSYETLKYLQKYARTCQIGLLLHKWIPDWESLCMQLNCLSVHVFDEILTFDRVQKIKSMNKLVLSYTVNEIDRARELYSWGVDALFTDMPSKMLKICK